MSALAAVLLQLKHASTQQLNVGRIGLRELSPVALYYLIQVVTNLSGKSIVETIAADCLLRLVESKLKLNWHGIRRT